jgi:hypothetical protein
MKERKSIEEVGNEMEVLAHKTETPIIIITGVDDKEHEYREEESKQEVNAANSKPRALKIKGLENQATLEVENKKPDNKQTPKPQATIVTKSAPTPEEARELEGLVRSIERQEEREKMAAQQEKNTAGKKSTGTSYADMVSLQYTSGSFYCGSNSL